MLLAEGKLKNFSLLKIFITANNQELESRFHLFTAKACTDTFIKHFPSKFAHLFYVLVKIKGKISNFDVSLYLCHFYDTICEVKLRKY